MLHWINIQETNEKESNKMFFSQSNERRVIWCWIVSRCWITSVRIERHRRWLRWVHSWCWCEIVVTRVVWNRLHIIHIGRWIESMVRIVVWIRWWWIKFIRTRVHVTVLIMISNAIIQIIRCRRFCQVLRLKRWRRVWMCRRYGRVTFQYSMEILFVFCQILWCLTRL